MKALCLKHQCWEAVTGWEVQVEVNAEGEEVIVPVQDAEQRRRRKVNDTALGLIINHVSDSYLDDLESVETAKEAWEILEQVCTTYGTLHLITFLEELVTMRKTDNISMTDYLNKINNCNKKLKDSGFINLPDAVIAAFYLRGLPRDRYETFIRSIELKDGDLSTQNIKAKLLKRNATKTW